MGASESKQPEDGAYPGDEGPQSSEKIPHVMKAVQLVSYVKDKPLKDLQPHFRVTELMTPVPKPGEVLVKIHCSPINPSDVGRIRGTDPEAPEPPIQLGLEGSGRVVVSGGGIMGWRVLGKRVSIITSQACLWAEYAVVPALQCVPLPDDVTYEEGSTALVNPLTVLSFVEIAKAGYHKSVLHSPGSSQVGKMLARIMSKNNIPLIAVVRRSEQKQEMDDLKLDNVHTIVSSEANWLQQLTAKCRELNCTLAFDAIAGGNTGTMLSAVMPGGVVYVYGNLASQPSSGISGKDLYEDKCVKGFFLGQYLSKKNMMGKLSIIQSAVSMLKAELKTEIRAVYPMHKLADAIETYWSNMSAGKLCLGPNLKEVRYVANSKASESLQAENKRADEQRRGAEVGAGEDRKEQGDKAGDKAVQAVQVEQQPAAMEEPKKLQGDKLKEDDSSAKPVTL